MKSDSHIVAIAVILIAVMLIGEIVVYTSGTDSFNADATITNDGDGIEYSVSSSGSNIYSVLITDNDSFKSIDTLYIYYDSTYESNYQPVTVAVGAKALTQEYYIEQLIKTVEYRGLSNVITVDADELEDLMKQDTSSSGQAVVVISGALPDTVYAGVSSDYIFNWMSNGGTLYWLGSLLGSCYATTTEIITVTNDYQTLFFGGDCLNTTNTSYAGSEIIDNEYGDLLSLTYNNVKYAVDMTAMKTLTNDCLFVGFTEDGYASITFVKYGNGMICVLGGDYSNKQISDLAQIITSQLCYKSELVDSYNGSVTRSTSAGTILTTVPTNHNIVVYIYFGGDFPVYGEAFIFSAV